MDTLRALNPFYIFVAVGIASILIARYGTHFEMPGWIEFSLRWGGWAMLLLSALYFFGVFEYIDRIPI